MIYTVTLNPAIDCTMELEEYCSGKVNRAYRETFTAGGKGINMSVILSRLGIDTMALGFSGGDTGHLLHQLLDKLNCPHNMTPLKGQLTRINVKIHAAGEETEINGKGPDISEKELADFIESLEKIIAENDTLILAGSVPDSVPKSIYKDIIRRFSNRNVRIIADTSGKLLSELLEMHPFLIKPNNFELGEICGREINTREEAFAGAEQMQKMGARNVLVSLAEKGSVLLCEDGKRYEIDAPKGSVKNSVGAGDSMVAGFLAGLELFGNYETALALGTAAGSATAFSDLLAEKNEIEQIFHKFYPNLSILAK